MAHLDQEFCPFGEVSLKPPFLLCLLSEVLLCMVTMMITVNDLFFGAEKKNFSTQFSSEVELAQWTVSE